MRGPVTFGEPVTPLDGAALREHTSVVLGHRLPELPEFTYPRSGTIRIVANGPSARSAPVEAGGPTIAINGALDLFVRRDMAPTYWAACDPQELVVDFLADAPPHTEYLVASKCHPRVFERLLSLGRKITVWHVDESATDLRMIGLHPVRSATSITVTIFDVLERLGWRSFETWGWDGCFMDGRHHAGDQDHDAQVIELDVAGQKFQTTGTWALEAQDADARLRHCPYPVAICGGGMIGAILQQAWMEDVRKTLIQRVA